MFISLVKLPFIVVRGLALMDLTNFQVAFRYHDRRDHEFERPPVGYDGQSLSLLSASYASRILSMRVTKT